MNKILSHTDGPIATLTFNNPERHNAMSLDMWRDAASALDAFVHDPAVPRSDPDRSRRKHSSPAQTSPSSESERATTDAVAILYNAAVDQFSEALINSPKPTNERMIRGYCMKTGGIGIAVCCDLLICNETSKFGVPAAKLGLGYGFSNIRRLMDLVGPANFVTDDHVHRSPVRCGRSRADAPGQSHSARRGNRTLRAGHGHHDRSKRAPDDSSRKVDRARTSPRFRRP